MFHTASSVDVFKIKTNLSEAELHALNSLIQNTNVKIQKVDQDNTVIIDNDACKRNWTKSL